MAFRTLRELYGRIDEELWTLAGRAAQLVEWDRTHIHCGRCGTPTEHAPGERARRCPVCGHSAFPRLSPAVIMRVTRGDEILLARAQRFPGRDVQRARGLRRARRDARGVRRARARGGGRHRGRPTSRYFASQPWPFPHSLMIGFTATWVSGDLRIEEAELVDARWFTRDDLPELPGQPLDRPQADRRLALSLGLGCQLVGDDLAVADEGMRIHVGDPGAHGAVGHAQRARHGLVDRLQAGAPSPRSCGRAACGSGSSA